MGIAAVPTVLISPRPPLRVVTADDLVPQNFMPLDNSVEHKQKLPACDECYGCTTNLTVLVSP